MARVTRCIARGCLASAQRGQELRMRISSRAFLRAGVIMLALCAVPAQTPFAAPAHADDRAVVSIHDIQGRRHISPLSGQKVTDVRGIVTATRARGFYLQ